MAAGLEGQGEGQDTYPAQIHKDQHYPPAGPAESPRDACGETHSTDGGYGLKQDREEGAALYDRTARFPFTRIIVCVRFLLLTSPDRIRSVLC